jgi:hypothetical protein
VASVQVTAVPARSAKFAAAPSKGVEPVELMSESDPEAVLAADSSDGAEPQARARRVASEAKKLIGVTRRIIRCS